MWAAHALNTNTHARTHTRTHNKYAHTHTHARFLALPGTFGAKKRHGMPALKPERKEVEESEGEERISERE